MYVNVRTINSEYQLFTTPPAMIMCSIKKYNNNCCSTTVFIDFGMKPNGWNWYTGNHAIFTYNHIPQSICITNLPIIIKTPFPIILYGVMTLHF